MGHGHTGLAIPPNRLVSLLYRISKTIDCTSLHLSLSDNSFEKPFRVFDPPVSAHQNLISPAWCTLLSQQSLLLQALKMPPKSSTAVISRNDDRTFYACYLRSTWFSSSSVQLMLLISKRPAMPYKFMQFLCLCVRPTLSVLKFHLPIVPCGQSLPVQALSSKISSFWGRLQRNSISFNSTMKVSEKNQRRGEVELFLVVRFSIDFVADGEPHHLIFMDC